MGWKEVCKIYNEAEATLIAGKLESEGITAVIVPSFSNALANGFFKVMVEDAYYQAALLILSNEEGNSK